MVSLTLFLVVVQAAAMPVSQPSRSPAPQPSQAGLPASKEATDHISSGNGIPAYFGCIRQQSTFWMGDPAPVTHVESVMAACDPLVPAAAADTAPRMLASPSFAEPAAAFLAKQGHPVDLVPALEHELRRMGRLGATAILAGDKARQAVSFRITVTPDGVKEEDPASATPTAPADGRPTAPVSETH